MSLQTLSIEDILGKNGALSRSLEGFEYRHSQIEMACLIRDALMEKIPAIVEAGTGTGKTFGYLVPLILSDKRCVISTGTKNLQEQIFFKDIPLLTKATGLKVSALLMKGRKNYLCLHRYHQFFAATSLLKKEQDALQRRLEKWLHNTAFADRAELEWMADDDPLWDNLSASSEQCLGSECLHFGECFLNLLRGAAAKSQLIIVNHHLFFADLMVKKSGFGEIIPRFQAAVFDEAHNLEDIATVYFGQSVSTAQLSDFVQDVEKEMKRKKKDFKRIKKELRILTVKIEALREPFQRAGDKGRLDEEAQKILSLGPGKDIKDALLKIQSQLKKEETGEASLLSLMERAYELEHSLERLVSIEDPDWLKWYEARKRAVIFHASPLDISKEMQELLYKKVNRLVFTSATLSTNGNFVYIRSRLGLPAHLLEGIMPSPFDLKAQTLMYVPQDLPLPNDPLFCQKIAERIIRLMEITSGRALILFTSYANLRLVHQLVKDKINYKIYKQGDAPRSVLLEDFKQDTHSVLMATGSFWQGVDVPGETLSCLIIDKLPFDSPGEPLVAARIDSIRSQGGNPFMEYQLPSAIIALKQGLGRLIRKSSDRGLLSVLDKRILISRYGQFFFNSLPEIPKTHDLGEVKKFFSHRDLGDTDFQKQNT